MTIDSVTSFHPVYKASRNWVKLVQVSLIQFISPAVNSPIGNCEHGFIGLLSAPSLHRSPTADCAYESVRTSTLHVWCVAGSVLSVVSIQNVESKTEKCRAQNSIFTSINQENDRICCHHMSDFKAIMHQNPISV